MRGLCALGQGPVLGAAAQWGGTWHLRSGGSCWISPFLNVHSSCVCLFFFILPLTLLTSWEPGILLGSNKEHHSPGSQTRRHFGQPRAQAWGAGPWHHSQPVPGIWVPLEVLGSCAGCIHVGWPSMTAKMPDQAAGCNNLMGFLELVFAAILNTNYTPGPPSTSTLHRGVFELQWVPGSCQGIKSIPLPGAWAAAAPSAGRAAAGSAQVKSWMRGWEKKKSSFGICVTEPTAGGIKALQALKEAICWLRQRNNIAELGLGLWGCCPGLSFQLGPAPSMCTLQLIWSCKQLAATSCFMTRFTT